jgi:hypothetical protein
MRIYAYTPLIRSQHVSHTHACASTPTTTAPTTDVQDSNQAALLRCHAPHAFMVSVVKLQKLKVEDMYRADAMDGYMTG